MHVKLSKPVRLKARPEEAVLPGGGKPGKGDEDPLTDEKGQPVETTDIAIVNLAIGDDSIAVSLYPCTDKDGKRERAPEALTIPFVGVRGSKDVTTLLDTITDALQEFIAGRGA